ncbi:MAG TPA: DNA gyrase inhibitor YacG [Geobacteraceae bacterium]|nr:DNA gyrase inhibitor YacG [Geobacteraceae bacterium]
MTSDAPKNVKCPICRKPVSWKGNPFRPFCSERCKMIDLGAWAGEEYRIPDKKTPVDEEPEE